MADEDYRNDFPEEPISSVFIKKDPETNEVLGPSTRPLTRREIRLKLTISEIKKDVDNIFLRRKDRGWILTDIEQDVAALAEKVKRYAEGAS